ncbi:uncharacterized [Tachysurus ichikawai]
MDSQGRKVVVCDNGTGIAQHLEVYRVGWRFFIPYSYFGKSCLSLRDWLVASSFRALIGSGYANVLRSTNHVVRNGIRVCEEVSGWLRLVNGM